MRVLLRFCAVGDPEHVGKLLAQELGGLIGADGALSGGAGTHPGVYCLRSNETNWDEERLWRTYTMLTDLESVFRSLKSELGLRPVYHSKEERADG